MGSDIAASVADGKIVLKAKSDSKRARIQWGTARALVNNMVAGVSKGFTKNLEIKAWAIARRCRARISCCSWASATKSLSRSRTTSRSPREKPTSITITGADKQRVGQVAAVIRAYRKPEPYKGKGIKYSNETVRRKEGKKK